jgi:hypothetical protein
MLPVIFKKKGVPQPETSLYHEVASNGIFQVRDTPIYRAVVRTDGPIPGLLREEETLEIRFPHLPTPLVEEVLAFLREAYDRYGGEAMVVIYYSPESSEFRVRVPPQTIPAYRDRHGRWRAQLRLRYGPVGGPPGFVRLGTIHSHADLPAYSSHTDCDDERFEDGLHITFGHMHRRVASASAAFVTNGARFRLGVSEVVKDCTIPERPACRDWMGRIELEEVSPPLASWSYWDGPIEGREEANDRTTKED